MKTAFQIITLTLLICSGVLNAQNSGEKYLDRVYKRVSEAPAVQINFTYRLQNKEAEVNQTTEGTLYLSGIQYHLTLFGTTQLFDGEKTYTIIPDNEEVMISNYSPNNEGGLDPASLFSFYKDGYRIELKEVTSENQAFIQLFPIDSSSEISEIIAQVDLNTDQLISLSQIGLNETQTILLVESYEELSAKMPSKTSFDRAYYEGLGFYFIED
jgi:hypothetical protein